MAKKGVRKIKGGYSACCPTCGHRGELTITSEPNVWELHCVPCDAAFWRLSEERQLQESTHRFMIPDQLVLFD